MARLIAVVVGTAFICVSTTATSAQTPASAEKTGEHAELIQKRAGLSVQRNFGSSATDLVLLQGKQDGPFFHADSYMTDTDPWGHCSPAGGNDGLSWWCGKQDASYAGGDGYGNNWWQYLVYEDIDVSECFSEATYVSLRYHYRLDSEPGCDLIYFEVWEPLSTTWQTHSQMSGSSGGWQVGYETIDFTDLQADGTMDFRFRFVSDDSDSDEDMGFNSNGGAIAIDALCLYEETSGTVCLLECDQSVGVPKQREERPEPCFFLDFDEDGIADGEVVERVDLDFLVPATLYVGVYWYEEWDPENKIGLGGAEYGLVYGGTVPPSCQMYNEPGADPWTIPIGDPWSGGWAQLGGCRDALPEFIVSLVVTGTGSHQTFDIIRTTGPAIPPGLLQVYDCDMAPYPASVLNYAACNGFPNAVPVDLQCSWQPTATSPITWGSLKSLFR